MLYRNLDPSKPKNYVEKASRENLGMPMSPTEGAAAERYCVAKWVRSGGDTMWSNMVMAYANLPGTIKQRIDGLFAAYAEHLAQLPIATAARWPRRTPPPGPVVLTHPETARRSCSSTRRSRPISRTSSTSRTSGNQT
jgi:taurine dioxygenase